MKASVINNLKKAGLCLFGMGIAAINASGATAAELQAEIDLLQVRSKVNFLSLCVVICVMMKIVLRLIVDSVKSGKESGIIVQLSPTTLY